MQAFTLYRDRILDAAGAFNLTAIRAPLEIERRHFLESLALGRELVRLQAVPGDAVLRALDVGSGAGFPGIPLKIAWPRWCLALADANEKRCRFLRETIAALGLADAHVLEGRAEALGHHPEHRAAYDLVLARAVAPLAVLLEYTLPFLRLGGLLAAPKGSSAAREAEGAARALEELGGELVVMAPFTPPGGREQTISLVRKIRPTPDRYPRRPGTPRKRPLA